jgi:hypothetical protein
MKFFSFLFILLFFIVGNSCAVLKNEQNWRLSEKKGVCTITSGQLIAPYKFKENKNHKPILALNLNLNDKDKSYTKLIFGWYLPKNSPPINFQIGDSTNIFIKGESCTAMKNGTTICFVTGQDHKEIINAVNVSDTINLEIFNHKDNMESWVIRLIGVRELIGRCREI